MKLQLKEEIIPAGERELRICSVADAERLVEAARDEWELPFWAELWPAARGLARYLARMDLTGRSALELGCGVGLAGIAAALAGAAVVQTDRAPLALDVAARNARANDAPVVARICADWRFWHIRERFDLILGSDILYEPALHPALLAIFEGNLAPAGRVLLADTGRRPAERFVESLDPVAWRWEMDEEVVVVDGQKVPVYLYDLARPGPGAGP